MLSNGWPSASVVRTTSRPSRGVGRVRRGPGWRHAGLASRMGCSDTDASAASLDNRSSTRSPAQSQLRATGRACADRRRERVAGDLERAIQVDIRPAHGEPAGPVAGSRAIRSWQGDLAVRLQGARWRREVELMNPDAVPLSDDFVTKPNALEWSVGQFIGRLPRNPGLARRPLRVRSGRSLKRR